MNVDKCDTYMHTDRYVDKCDTYMHTDRYVDKCDTYMHTDRYVDKCDTYMHTDRYVDTAPDMRVHTCDVDIWFKNSSRTRDQNTRNN